MTILHLETLSHPNDKNSDWTYLSGPSCYPSLMSVFLDMVLAEPPTLLNWLLLGPLHSSGASSNVIIDRFCRFRYSFHVLTSVWMIHHAPHRRYDPGNRFSGDPRSQLTHTQLRFEFLLNLLKKYNVSESHCPTT